MAPPSSLIAKAATGLLMAASLQLRDDQNTTSSLPAGPTYYAPRQSNVNDLSFAINGTGHVGIYNSSFTPDESYGIYNWCNMPHVRAKEYPVASSEYKLEYVEVIHRHHKRTPYASNTFPVEDIEWSCSGEGVVHGGRNSTGLTSSTIPIQWETAQNPANPFSRDAPVGFANSTCQFPQITDEGLIDSYQHGEDLRKLYHDKLGFLPYLPSRDQVRVRVSNNDITSQVGSALIPALFPRTKDLTVDVQNAIFDSLAPSYSCPAAVKINTAYMAGGKEWPAHLNASVEVYGKLREVSGIEKGENDGGYYASFDHYFDNLSAKQCHGKSLPCNVNSSDICVDQELADTVYRLGNWEYSWQWRDALNSTLYSALHYGAFFNELKSNLQNAASKTDAILYRHHIAHDGSIASIIGFLQFLYPVWPGMGSEVVFELYSSSSSSSDFLVRVLWNGQILETSIPGMERMDMISLDAFKKYIYEMVGGSGDALYESCNP